MIPNLITFLPHMKSHSHLTSWATFAPWQLTVKLDMVTTKKKKKEKTKQKKKKKKKRKERKKERKKKK